MTDAALDPALLGALAPRGLVERLRLRVGGGYTVLQVWERLPPDARAALGEADPVAARAAVERVRRRLDALAGEGVVVRSRARMTVPLNTKGPRDILVDVYRGGAEGRRRR